jgi:hypothetical protein
MWQWVNIIICFFYSALNVEVTNISYYDMNMKCPPQAHVIDAWSPAGGTILGGSGNI